MGEEGVKAQLMTAEGPACCASEHLQTTASFLHSTFPLEKNYYFQKVYLYHGKKPFFLNLCATPKDNERIFEVTNINDSKKRLGHDNFQTIKTVRNNF